MAASTAGAVSESVERLKRKYLGQDRGNNVKPAEPLCTDSATKGPPQEPRDSAECGGIRHEERALQDLHTLIKMHTCRLDAAAGHRLAGGGSKEATSGEGESDGQPSHSRITQDAYTETDVTLTSQVARARPGFTQPPGTDSSLTSPDRGASRRHHKSQGLAGRHTRARRPGRRAPHGIPCSADPACSSHVSWECAADVDEDEYDDIEDDAASDGVDGGIGEDGADKRWDSSADWKRKGADSSLGDLRHVYAELAAIHSKLQRESTALAERAVRAAEREGRLAAREEEVAARHGGALTKLRTVQAQVQGTLHALRQQHAAEVQELSEALKEKSRENKRIKASFDTLKDMNDSLKKQLSELVEQNKRLETQAHRVQQRLENLQRKFDFQRAQKGRTVLLTQAHDGQLRRVVEKPDKQPPPQPHKIKQASAGLCELLGLLLSWVPDLHPLPDPNAALSLEKSSKALPLVVEQLSSTPSVSKRLQLPLVKFVLWALGRMDGTSQHTTLTATCRRLGEELFRPSGSARGADGSAESSPEHRPHIWGGFFRSSEPEVRLLSSLVILRTLSQADVLAQVLDSVCSDLQSEESKRLFVRHGGVAVVTTLLTSPCKGLLGDAVGVLLLVAMSTDPVCVEEFLAACSTERWFRSCSQLLRTPHLDPLIPEKMSVVLQKLSKIKTNRRLFEACSLHIQLQEIMRTAEPHQVFLIVNLRSTLHQLEEFRGT